MPIYKLIEKLRGRLDDPSFPEIAEWKASHPGGMAVGYFPVYAPVELIHAAGMLPVQVAGAMGRIKLDEADGYLQSFVCSIGRSTMELKLDGHLDNLDAMIFPSTCEISRGLCGVLRRHDPEKPIIYIHFPQNLESANAKGYLVGELERVKIALEEMTGKTITDEAIFKSFEAYNRRWELLRELEEIRYSHPELLSASELYIIRLAGMNVTVEEHSEILAEAIEALKDTPAHHEVRIRMLLSGAFCERPRISMLETIEDEGVAIVADDMLIGQRWWTESLPASGNPLEILAEYYLKKSVYNPVVYRPHVTPCESVLRAVELTGAEGIIISSAKSCHPANHDDQCVITLCEAQGIPYIRLQYGEDQRLYESILVQVQALMEARTRLPFAGTEKSGGEGRED